MGNNYGRLKAGNLVVIRGKLYKVMAPLKKSPYFKRIYREIKE